MFNLRCLLDAEVGRLRRQLGLYVWRVPRRVRQEIGTNVSSEYRCI